ncbi:tyrosine-type recombinase/integrase [Arsenicicoccus dermatophilus]|uniref:tyrosine-type recombinase/integrase n=1 Tax=Arsenicicoccus dermatophilus TaxID=1076331 RepID=UPI003916F53D
MASLARRPDGRWRARYRDDDGREHARHFRTRAEGRRWLDEITASRIMGTYVDPDLARITVGQWADRWLAGYRGKRSGTVRQAEVHLRVIRADWDGRTLRSIKPSEVRVWTARLSERYAPSTTYAIYRRFQQLMLAAIDEGIITRSPCRKADAPPQAGQRAYVLTGEQVWALHDAMPPRLQVALLLGAFAGLRIAEVTGLRARDVDLDAGVVHVRVQHPCEPLKTRRARRDVPIPTELADRVQAALAAYPGPTVVTNAYGRQASPAVVEHAFRAARATVPGLPAGVRFHDLRHHFASYLIGAGLDLKLVQLTLGHQSATTTLDVYGHLLDVAGDATRAATRERMAARADQVRTVGVGPPS